MEWFGLGQYSALPAIDKTGNNTWCRTSGYALRTNTTSRLTVFVVRTSGSINGRLSQGKTCRSTFLLGTISFRCGAPTLQMFALHFREYSFLAWKRDWNPILTIALEH